MPEPLDRAALDELLGMAGGDAATFADLLDAFLTDADRCALELDAAIAADDHSALVRPAHSLKSNALNVGAGHLADLSRSIELEARDGRVADAAARVASVLAELDVVRAAVLSARRDALDGA